jgi:integrase
MLEGAAEAAGIKIKVHPHMLRHACGFALANKGHHTHSLQAYLGHKNIEHTVRRSPGGPRGSMRRVTLRCGRHLGELQQPSVGKRGSSNG